MTEKTIHLAALKNPFPAASIHWRIGATNKDKTKGIALAYLDARDVMERLDEVCGPENWQCEYPHAGQKTVCRIGIRINGEWVWKSNGAGDTDIEGEKGALSDAFKRAAVLWGIGQYLYSLGTTWVSLNNKGYRPEIAKNEYARLHKLVGGQSSNQLNQDKAWDQFLHDLSDCQTVAQLTKLYKAYRDEGWPQPYLDNAADHCAERKAFLLENAPSNDDTFPGDLPPLAAG